MNVAFIPVRGGSKTIPLKNIREMAGKPLVYWAAKAANDCNYIDKVYIATDSSVIREVAEQFELEKIIVIGRNKDTATDIASTESAMLEFARQYEFDNIVLVQATSPLLTSDDLNGGFESYNMNETDSVLSVVRQKRFQWGTNAKGYVQSTNYDYNNRPRRQDFEGYLVENGAFYITSKAALLKSGNRLSGKIRAYEMDESTYFEIDELSDWEIVAKQLYDRIAPKGNLLIPEIKMFLTDCDGCLTDGGMYYSENGDELKRFNTLDGMGFQLLREKAILTGIVTGEQMNLNKRRSSKIKVDILEQGIRDKQETVKKLCSKYHIDLKNVAYIGDDINDLDVIKIVGFGCSVPNGIKEVKNAAKYITHRMGGQGAIREVIDLILSNVKNNEE